MHSIDILLNKGLPLKPHIAVMMHNINDYMTIHLMKSYWNKSPTRSLLVSSNIRTLPRYVAGIVKSVVPQIYSRLGVIKARFFTSEKEKDEFARDLGKAKVKPKSIDRQKIAYLFENSIRTFVAVSKANGVIPVLMTQASRFKDLPPGTVAGKKMPGGQGRGITYHDFKSTYDLIKVIIRTVGRDSGVAVIDLATEVPRELSYMYDMVHYTNDGSKLVAALVAARLSVIVEESGRNRD
jgi:hypothetical protein